MEVYDLTQQLREQLACFSQTTPSPAGKKSEKYQSAQILSGDGVIKNSNDDKIDQIRSLPNIDMSKENEFEKCELARPHQLIQLISRQIHCDWFGKSIEPVINYGLALGDSDLAIWAWREKAPFLKYDLGCGQFFEGLWNQDVFELFISLDKSETYFEINLSPQGAWWLQRFEKYRVRQSEWNIRSNSDSTKTIKCFSNFNEKSWAVAAIIPISILDSGNMKSISLRTVLKCNVCSILYNNKGVEHYATASSPPAGALPDFHLEGLRKGAL